MAAMLAGCTESGLEVFVTNDDAELEQHVVLGVTDADDALGLLLDRGLAELVLDGRREHSAGRRDLRCGAGRVVTLGRLGVVGTASGQREQEWTYFRNRTNPYFALTRFENNIRDRVFGNVTASYELLPWLTAQGRVGQDYWSRDQDYNRPSGSAVEGPPTQGFVNGNYVIDVSWFRELNADFLLMANRTAGDFGLDATVGGNYMRRKLERENTLAEEFYAYGLYSLQNSPRLSPQYSISERGVNSLYGSAEVSFRDLLFLTGFYDGCVLLRLASDKAPDAAANAEMAAVPPDAATEVVGGATLTVDEGGSATRGFSGTISENGSLVKSGTHTLVLSGSNSLRLYYGGANHARSVTADPGTTGPGGRWRCRLPPTGPKRPCPPGTAQACARRAPANGGRVERPS